MREDPTRIEDPIAHVYCNINSKNPCKQCYPNLVKPPLILFQRFPGRVNSYHVVDKDYQLKMADSSFIRAKEGLTLCGKNILPLKKDNNG